MPLRMTHESHGVAAAKAMAMMKETLKMSNRVSSGRATTSRAAMAGRVYLRWLERAECNRGRTGQDRADTRHPVAQERSY